MLHLLYRLYGRTIVILLALLIDFHRLLKVAHHVRGGLGMDAFLLLFSVYTDYSTLDRKKQYSFQKPLQFLPSYRCWLIFGVEGYM